MFHITNIAAMKYDDVSDFPDWYVVIHHLFCWWIYNCTNYLSNDQHFHEQLCLSLLVSKSTLIWISKNGDMQVVWAFTLYPVQVVKSFNFVSLTPRDGKWYVDVGSRQVVTLELATYQRYLSGGQPWVLNGRSIWTNNRIAKALQSTRFIAFQVILFLPGPLLLKGWADAT